MPLDPLLQPILDAMRDAPEPDPNASVEERRAQANAALDQTFLFLTEPAPPIASADDHRVPVAGGEIVVRIYRPDQPGPLPCHLYIHGGGFSMGTLDQLDTTCQWIAHDVGCAVASVDYRLAPEHKFPTAPEDCYAALCWVADNATTLDIDPDRISVGGGSAGGNLAAVIALMARDRKGPRIVLQVLEIPCTDFVNEHPSLTENGEGYILTRDGMQLIRAEYLADPADAANPYASPLLAEDLTGLPSAVVMTAEFDPLRDEGEAYGARLAAAGVPTVVRRWDGQIHGACTMTNLLPSARACRDEIHAALRAAFDGHAISA